MNAQYPLSQEEEAAIEALGGFDHAARTINRLLCDHGFQRALFTRTETNRIKAVGCAFNGSPEKQKNAPIRIAQIPLRNLGPALA